MPRKWREEKNIYEHKTSKCLGGFTNVPSFFCLESLMVTVDVFFATVCISIAIASGKTSHVYIRTCPANGEKKKTYTNIKPANAWAASKMSPLFSALSR
jgi:hypothetical protein